MRAGPTRRAAQPRVSRSAGTQPRPNRKLPALRVAVGAAIVLAPLVLLLTPGRRPSSVDWENGLWTVAYTSASLRHHGWFPEVFSAEGLTGLPVPVLYGPLLYPMLAIPALPLGAEIGLRVAVTLVWILQFALVSRTIRLASGSRLTATVVAALVSWAVYPLTNLYNRAAIGEFFATTLLTCAACAGLCALLEPDGGVADSRRTRLRRLAMALLCGWCGAAAAGAHGITAMVGGFVLACLAPVALLLRSVPQGVAPRQGNVAASASTTADPPHYFPRALVAAALLAGVLVVLAPWLYAASRFAGQFHVQEKPLAYIEAYDSWSARLWPVPFDNRWAVYEGRKGQPYLDAQLNVALLVLLLGVAVDLAVRRRPPRDAWRRCGPLLALSLALFVGLLLLSVTPSLGQLLPTGVAGTVQFAYRLVTYQNLTLLSALVAALMLRRAAEHERSAAAAASEPSSGGTARGLGPADWVPLVIAAVLGVAALGVKLSHAATGVVPVGQIAGAPDFNDEDAMLKFPRSYYGWGDYVVLDPARQFPPATRLARAGLVPQSGPEYGRPAPITAEVPQEVWAATTILAFPWNRVVLDGVVLSESETKTTPDYLAVRVPAGRHTIGYAFAPAPGWSALRNVSLVVFAAWGVVMLLLFCAAAVIARSPDDGGKNREDTKTRRQPQRNTKSQM